MIPIRLSMNKIRFILLAMVGLLCLLSYSCERYPDDDFSLVGKWHQNLRRSRFIVNDSVIDENITEVDVSWRFDADGSGKVGKGRDRGDGSGGSSIHWRYYPASFQLTVAQDGANFLVPPAYIVRWLDSRHVMLQLSGPASDSLAVNLDELYLNR